MKKLLFLLSLLAALSCHKPGTVSTNNNEKIEGSWELRRSEGGIAGTIVYAPANGQVYSFTADNTFTCRSNGTVADSGSYTLTTLPGGQWSLELRSSMVSSISINAVTIKGTQLIFLPSQCCVDIPTLTFSRI
jgi:hypothetical protein